MSETSGEQTNADERVDQDAQDQDAHEEVIGAGAAAPGTTEKDPDAWVTGDEPMTGAQRSYLDTLARDAGETLPASMTKAEASQHIDRLQAATGRGDDASG